MAAGRLRDAPWRAPVPRLPLHTAIAEGARFVRAQPLLRAIAWNAGFFALMVVAMPLTLGPLAGLRALPKRG